VSVAVLPLLYEADEWEQAFNVSNGCEREAEVAEALRALGYLSYHVAVGTWEGNDAVLIQHVEDANPEWEFVGELDDFSKNDDPVPVELWLPYAAVAIALGINDRHGGNGLVMRHRTTGELRVASIDHECECEDGETWPFWMAVKRDAFEAPTWSQVEEAVNEVIDTAKARGLDHLIRLDAIESVLGDEQREYFQGVLQDA
jgi:hypothetical protein